MTTEAQTIIGLVRRKATRIIALGHQGRPERCMELGGEICGLLMELEKALGAGPNVATLDTPDNYDLTTLEIADDPEPGE